MLYPTLVLPAGPGAALCTQAYPAWRWRGMAEAAAGSELHPRAGAIKLDRVAVADQDLMLRVGTGDREACRVLVERHLDRILAFAERTLGNRGEAEEVAQEVFTRVWTHAARWEPRGAKVTTWLFRVAMNLCLNRIARRREVPLETAPDPVAPTPQPSEILESAEIGVRVNAALQSLPEKQRIAITLCHYQGWKNAEAAEMMDLSIEAVESLLSRGRRGLKKRLAAVAPALLGGVR
jgi:RNA polymerase sigma-70 factor (ECF subfamily)